MEAWTDIADLYELRKPLKDAPAGSTDAFDADLYKTVANACYGAMCQRSFRGQKRVGRFVCWPYASFITSATHVQIWEMTDTIGWEKRMEAKTDSLVFRGCAPKWFKPSKELGEWDLKFNGESYKVIMSGITERANKHLKKRGIPELTHDLVEKATGPTLTFPTKPRPISMLVGMRQHREEDIGKFIGDERTLSLESNLLHRIYKKADLTFEVINRRWVQGIKIPARMVDAVNDRLTEKDMEPSESTESSTA